MTATLPRRIVSELIGTGFLVAAVIGSGIMGERLAAGNVAIALLANTIATGAALVALILTFGPISGAHFNPAVTLADAIEHGLTWGDAGWYVAAQCLGGIGGTGAAHLMFRLPLVSISRHVRSGPAQIFSEFVATFGLLAVIWGCSRRRSEMVPFAVGAYITAAYWFTASTSFANPAVTISRCLTDTFAGIRPGDVPGFIVAQVLGAIAATTVFRWLVPNLNLQSENIVVPYGDMLDAEPQSFRQHRIAEGRDATGAPAVTVPAPRMPGMRNTERPEK
jgi:glycerol uptake facilitator-like aquaporin